MVPFEVLDNRENIGEPLWGLLHLGASCAPSECLFEVLRSAVWSMAGPAGRVHINRVLSSALPTRRVLSHDEGKGDELLRAELRETLYLLRDVGDLLEWNGGYWGPATARLIQIPKSTMVLLVGGIPLALLPVATGSAEFHGPHRLFRDTPAALAKSLPVEPLASWADQPSVSVEKWASDVVSLHAPIPYHPEAAEAFEFYSPDTARPGAPQFRRWTQNAGDRTGLALARRTRVYGSREYRLVELAYGRIVKAGDLANVDFRRLMYALDLAAQNPVRARAHRVGSRTEWHLTSALPRAEQRIFAAFGTLKIPDNRPFESRWTFLRNEDLALSMLSSLGIKLEP